MKNINSTYKYFFVFAVVILSSCSNFLTVEPQATIPDTNPIFDATSANEALNGVYSALYYGQTTFEPIGYLSGDNVKWTGSQSQVQEFINHQVNVTNSTVDGAWSTIYKTINNANNVIQKVPTVSDPNFTSDAKNNILGQAYFLRALAYFDLARTWGDVPIVTDPTVTATDNWGEGRKPVSDVYAQVLSDLNTAEPLLPTTTNRYQATAKTVWALKARYYIYQNDYANAEAYASKIINDSANYSLATPFSNISQAAGISEAVFYKFFNGTTETNGHYGQWQSAAGGGTYQWAPNDALVALLNDPTVGGTRSVLIAKDNQGRWYGNLYKGRSDPAYIIRIAELFLIRAEARAQQAGEESLALKDLNKVRVRAGLTASTATTKDDILLAIENESRVEFPFENHRWYDLVRTGRANTVLGVTDPGRYVMPLPVSQTLIDKSLVQYAPYN